jgi:hypothetical protein
VALELQLLRGGHQPLYHYLEEPVAVEVQEVLPLAEQLLQQQLQILHL